MNRKFVFWSTFVVGPLILWSYWRGVNAVDDPLVYWGNVSPSMQSFIVPWMFVAATGYLLMWHRFFFAWSEEDVARLHYPWQEEDGNGVQRLMVLYAAFMLTSLVWIDLTRIYIEQPGTFQAVLVVRVVDGWISQHGLRPSRLGHASRVTRKPDSLRWLHHALHTMHMVGRHLLGVALCLVRTALDILKNRFGYHVIAASPPHVHDRSLDAGGLYRTSGGRSSG